jgi:hypothetical protein
VEKAKTSECRKRFCRAYLRTLDPQRAAQEAGVPDGWAMLRDRAVRKRLGQMRESMAEQIRREDAVRRLAELAFGRANDGAALAMGSAEERQDVRALDLSAVSELKVTDKGVEIKFLDRVRALETLCGLLENDDDAAASFFQALEDAGGEAEPL